MKVTAPAPTSQLNYRNDAGIHFIYTNTHAYPQYILQYVTSYEL